MSTRCYDTDLNAAASAWIAPYLPAALPGGRSRTTNLRAVLNAIFYLLRTGCQWRLLPREFPRPLRSPAWCPRLKPLTVGAVAVPEDALESRRKQEARFQPRS